MQPSPLSISRSLSSFQTETLYPEWFNITTSWLPLISTPGNLQSPFCLYKLKWYHTTLVLSCLACLSYHNVLKAHPCCSTYQNIVPFKGWIIFHCTYKPCFVYPFAFDRHLGCFHQGCFLLVYLFFVFWIFSLRRAACGILDSPTRGQTSAPCSGSVES